MDYFVRFSNAKIGKIVRFSNAFWVDFVRFSNFEAKIMYQLQKVDTENNFRF